MLTEPKIREAEAMALRFYAQSLSKIEAAGFTMREAGEKFVTLEFPIGTDLVPTYRTPKVNLTDSKWVDSFLRNQDAAITKAQLRFLIEKAVAPLPVSSEALRAYLEDNGHAIA